MGTFHPLVPLCLPHDVEVVEQGQVLAEEMDDLRPHAERPVLVTQFDARYRRRFLLRDASTCPDADTVNRALPCHVDTARRVLLTHRHVSDRVITDALERRYETISLLLVDGLSYSDVNDWPEGPEPCFVDGPSITYGRTNDGHVSSDIGFAGIVGHPPLARRLADIGLPRSRGFSYWERETNDVSAVLFEGMPLARIAGMAKALERLSDMPLRGVFVQLVREGLDGLAHSRREVSPSEVQAGVEAVRRDYLRLVQIVAASGIPGAVYLVADHGILWRAQTTFVHLDCQGVRHPRYALEPPGERDHVSHFAMAERSYYLYHYPYLAAPIRRDDCGTHGGLSFQESIVPFVRVEVNL